MSNNNVQQLINECNNELSGISNKNLCGFITKKFNTVMEGVAYWRHHKNHKCYKCHAYGHIATDCDKVCKLCYNVHSSKLCVFSLRKIMKKIYKIVKKNPETDYENKVKKIDLEILQLHRRELKVAQPQAYSNLTIKSEIHMEVVQLPMIKKEEIKEKKYIEHKKRKFNPALLTLSRFEEQWARRRNDGFFKKFQSLFNKSRPLASQVTTRNGFHKEFLRQHVYIISSKYMKVAYPVDQTIDEVVYKEEIIEENREVQKSCGGHVELRTNQEVAVNLSNSLASQQHDLKETQKQIKKLKMNKTRMESIIIANKNYNKNLKIIEEQNNIINATKQKIQRVKREKNKLIGKSKVLKTKVYEGYNKLKQKEKEFYKKKDDFYNDLETRSNELREKEQGWRQERKELLERTLKAEGRKILTKKEKEERTIRACLGIVSKETLEKHLKELERKKKEQQGKSC